MRTLKANLAVFMKGLPELLPDHRGEFALNCHGRIETFKTPEKATEAGLRPCGNAHEFLVLLIEPLPSDKSH